MSKEIKKRGCYGRPSTKAGGGNREKREKREQILDSALDLFSRQGIACTTISQIAQHSDVTSAMVHYYFGNREGLLDVIASERVAPIIEYVWKGDSSDSFAEPREVITKFVDRLFELVERRPLLPLLWSREVLNAGGLLRKRVMDLMPLERFSSWRQFFADAQKAGTINPLVSPDLILVSIVGQVLLPLAAHDIVDIVVAKRALNREGLKKHALAVLLGGICVNRSWEDHDE